MSSWCLSVQDFESESLLIAKLRRFQNTPGPEIKLHSSNLGGWCSCLCSSLEKLFNVFGVQDQHLHYFHHPHLDAEVIPYSFFHLIHLRYPYDMSPYDLYSWHRYEKKQCWFLVNVCHHSRQPSASIFFLIWLTFFFTALPMGLDTSVAFLQLYSYVCHSSWSNLISQTVHLSI